MDELFNIAQQIEKQIRGEASPEEIAQINTWRSLSESNEKVYQALNDERHLVEKADVYDRFDQGAALTKFYDQIGEKEAKVVSFPSSTWIRYAATILIPVLLGAAMFYYFNRQAPGHTSATVDEVIIPGRDQAVLVLADGNEVTLDSESEFEAIQQGNVKASKGVGEIAYIHEEEKVEKDVDQETIFNELITPKGGNYQLSLADGTRVTLNADSRLRFPVDFKDSTRTVYLEGEAYFEVAHAGTPFIVNVDQLDVRVLGTKFNVSAYEIERQISTTLVEGSVRIETVEEQITIKPSEQAIWSTASATVDVQQVNPRYYISWLEGKLDFNNQPLEQVMQQLSRWYDFEFEFENEELRHFHFTATFNHEQPISEILETLSLTTEVQFELTSEQLITIK